MNKNYVGTYGVIKKNGGIDLIYSETEGEGNIFFSILKCILITSEEAPTFTSGSSSLFKRFW